MEITHDKFTDLAAELRAAAAAYYAGGGSQLMDDATYDVGIRRLREAANEHGWSEADDLLSQVAGGQGAGDIPHVAPMLSLDNAMDDGEMAQFFARVARGVGVPESEIEWVVEPKFDGMALEVVYRDGVLRRIVTRGNGTAGEDVTEMASAAAGIPARIAAPDGEVAVVGECVMTHDDFAEANRRRVAAGDHPFANPRNAVAGSLRSKHRTYRVPLTFYAYGVTFAPVADAYVADDAFGGRSYADDLAGLSSLGFLIATDVLYPSGPVCGSEAVLERIAAVETARSTLPMDTDGAVVKANRTHVRDALGASSRAPRWGIARKFAPDTRETDLLDIEVAVGRTGNLSFTAKVAPVYVGGVTIESVTVHNVSEIARKGFRLPVPGGSPQRVIVRRAGEVIPEIVGPANGATDGSAPYVPPATCPAGHDLDTSGTIWRCVLGRGCAIAAGIRYAVSRDCLDIEGMGAQIVDALVSSGVVGTVADLFALGLDDLLTVPRLGRSNTLKIVAQIDKARSLPLARIVTALGIRGTGRSMSRRIAAAFGSMGAILAATPTQMAEVEGIGPVKAPSIVTEVAELAPVIAQMAVLGVIAAGVEARPTDDGAAGDLPLAGMSVCVTGP